MSIKIMSQVWENGPTDHGELLVLLALADFCDDRGQCWPSMAAIAEKARMTERGARGAIARLEVAGYVRRDVNRGRGLSNLYTVKPEPENRNAVPGKEKNRNETTLKPERDDTKTGTAVPPEPSENHQEPSVDTHTAHRGDFDAFWSIVPRKVGKGAARKAYTKALALTDPDTLLRGMKRYAESVRSTEERYICHPATWLNQERWDDEPYRPQKSILDRIDERLSDGPGLQQPRELHHS